MMNMKKQHCIYYKASDTNLFNPNHIGEGVGMKITSGAHLLLHSFSLKAVLRISNFTLSFYKLYQEYPPRETQVKPLKISNHPPSPFFVRKNYKNFLVTRLHNCR